MYKWNVGILLYNSGLLFLGRRAKGGWSLPQGDQETSETFLETAKRELYEETGISADNVQLLEPLFSYALPKGGGKFQRWVRADWREQEIGFDLGPYREFVGYEWVKPEVVVQRCVWFKKGIYRKLLGQP